MNKAPRLFGKISQFSLHQIGTVKIIKPFAVATYATQQISTTTMPPQMPLFSLPSYNASNLSLVTPKEMTYALPEQSLSGESYNYDIELQVHSCPKFLLSDFARLFPEVDIKAQGVNIVTIAQKTKNDMTSWSNAVCEERTQLQNNFISVSMVMTQALRSNSIWADFIDPTSGLPYFGDNVSEALFETDECYAHLGFELRDLGCCKVIAHKEWGTKTFVGSMFTFATAEQVQAAFQNVTK